MRNSGNWITANEGLKGTKWLSGFSLSFQGKGPKEEKFDNSPGEFKIPKPISLLPDYLGGQKKSGKEKLLCREKGSTTSWRFLLN